MPLFQTPKSSMKVAIIGGGPIGVEAALYGAMAGFDVHLFERGRLVENVRNWGTIGLFTEWKRNRSPLACRLLAAQNYRFAPDETCSTGDELADYVGRLAALEPLRGRISPQTEVVALTRHKCLKSDFFGDPHRADFPFRLMTKGIGGEKTRLFDAVIDATGVYATPNFAGDGGAPCPGEIQNARFIDYLLPDVAGRDKGRFSGKHSVVVGSGHSAASTLLAIADLIEAAPATRLTWLVRRDVPEHGLPYTLNPDDVSSGRQKLNRRANELTHHENVDFRPRSTIEKIARQNGRFQVTSGENVIECDNLVAHTGFRPDPALWRELQVVEHPATGGPAQLSDALLESNRRAGVGLSTGYAERQAVVEEAKPDEAPKSDIRVASPELLRLPEPNFFVIGIKSYGRDAGFLMQNGFRQVRDVYRLLAHDPSLDLYHGELD